MNSVLVEDFTEIHKQFKYIFEKLSKKSVLVTGCTGMITSYLCKLLLFFAEEYDIEVFLQCRNEEKANALFSDFGNNIRKHVLTFNVCETIPEEYMFDYIIHAASLASTFHFMNTPVEVMEPNVLGTWNLLEYSKKHNSRFIFFSSNSIYGEGGINKTLLGESDFGIVDPLASRSCYIESKRCAEQMCIAFCKEYSVKTSIVRICHTYGPTFDIKKDSRIIPRMINRIINGEDIELVSDPFSLIQYTYVADIVTAVLFVMLYGENGQAYNACGDESILVTDAIRIMIEAVGKSSIRLIEKPMGDDYAFRKGNGVNTIMLDNSRLKGLGWKRIWKNEEGFKRTVIKYICDNDY